FMIQGGDPQGNGSGGPGYKLNDEKITRDYKRGILAMANSGPNTNGSQFFIMHQDYELPKNYVIFGQVVKGIEVVDVIANIQTVDNGYKEESKPTEKVTIDKITVTEK
ncbi:peptidylprolyl isomerase, partial [Candidatus Gottesmanbacteria bacterium]|nr:peptidylprolyl isomerase [Candidatus Gottesmanbacteria bacterium]